MSGSARGEQPKQPKQPEQPEQSERSERSELSEAVAHLRDQQRRRRRWRPLIVAVAAVVVAAVLAWLVFFSPVFALRTVTVKGVDGALAEAVREAAHAPMGEPLARVDEGAVARNITALPQVAQVTVRRVPPSSLVLDVTPRRLTVAVTENGRWTLRDDHGVAFATADAPPRGLPRAEIDATNSSLVVAVATVAAALDGPLRDASPTIRAKSRESIQLTVDGRTIVWGSDDHSPTKNQVANALLRTKAKWIDVSAPSHPATR